MRLLLSLLLLCVALPVRAATGLSTPVFTNFFQEHFIVAPNAPPTQIIKSRIFGPATNIFNLTTNIYNNSYILYTNSDIFYGDVTLVVSNSIVTNIYDTIYNQFTTNIIDNSTEIITNTTVIITNTTFIINGNTNDLTQLWSTNAAGIYHPTITNTATIFVGQSAQAWWAPTLADGFVSIHDASVGDSQFNSLAIAAIDNVLQENYGTFTSTLGSGAAPAGAMQLLAATNFQNPSAPISKFSVALQPAYGEVLLDLMNNGVHEFAVSNQITSVQAIQLVPITNATLALGANQINVQSNSFISLKSLDPDPTLTTISLSTGLRDGMVLLLKNVGVALGFTLPNGSPLYDDPTKFVTLPGGTWVSTNYGDSMLLAGGLNGWTEVKRWGQDTNVQTEQLWELVSGHMRTVPDTLDDWQFRYQGVPQLTISTNGGVAVGPNTLSIYGSPLIAGEVLYSINDTALGDPNGSYVHFEVRNSTNGTEKTWLEQGMAIGAGFGGYMNGTAMDTNSNAKLFVLSWQTNFVNFNFQDTQLAHGAIMALDPYFQGTQLSPYYFDTAIPIGAGTNVLQILNYFTNIVGFGPDARITFGEGGTNVLYREPLVGTDLVYTNGYQYPTFKVYGSEGLPAYFGLTPGSYGTFAQASGPKGVALGWDTGLLAMGSSNVWGSTPFNLGAVTVPFADFHADGKAYVYGFNPHSGVDYSRLAISHSGTNGAVVFDSQSAGIAGDPVSFDFRFNNTNEVQIFPNDSIAIGRHTLALNGGPLLSGTVVMKNDTTLGDPNQRSMYASCTDGAGTGAWTLYSSSGEGRIQVATTGYGSDLTTTLSSAPGTAAFTSVYMLSSSNLWRFAPFTTNQPYYLNTAVDVPVNPLMAIANHDTNQVEIGPFGEIWLRPMTKSEKTALTPKDGLVVYQSDNTPGLRVYQSGAWMMISTVADP